MQIKVTRVEDGPAKVEVLNADGEVQSCTEVSVGQDVTLTVSGAVPSDIQVGEVCETDPENAETEAGTGEEDAGSMAAGADPDPA